jgi:hypothetical protein
MHHTEEMKIIMLLLHAFDQSEAIFYILHPTKSGIWWFHMDAKIVYKYEM